MFTAINAVDMLGMALTTSCKTGGVPLQEPECFYTHIITRTPSWVLTFILLLYRSS